VRLAVRVTPRAGRDAIEGWTADAAGRAVLKLRVAASATDGQANAAVLALLAKALGVAKSHLSLIGGQTARLKIVEIAGIEAADIARVFGSPPA
jgi:hypothetical protein